MFQFSRPKKSRWLVVTIAMWCGILYLRSYRREVVSGESPAIDSVLTQLQALVRETVTTEKRERALEILQIAGGK